MNKALTFTFAGLLLCGSLIAQKSSPEVKPGAMYFPDIPGYVTLKCDLHMHTVFSDGDVWPSIRVEEALKDGLDAISITDHLEYQPNSEDIPHEDRNRVYELALSSAKDKGLLVINGAEITRGMPPGHLNAIFIKDANKLMNEDPLEVLKEAREQGAFIFWNHPNWIAQKPDGIAELTDMHSELFKQGLIDGIEVVNGGSYSDEALQIAMDHELTVLGTSDLHGLIAWEYPTEDGIHRPVTLVFAREKTEEAMKEAMQERRTLVYYKNILAGEEKNLLPFLEACILVKDGGYMSSYTGESSVRNFTLINQSESDFILENRGEFTLHNLADIFVLPAHSQMSLKVNGWEEAAEMKLKFAVLNALTAPKQHPEIELITPIVEQIKPIVELPE